MSRTTDFLNLGQHGELAGSATAVRMPDFPCKGVMFKAPSSNSGVVYIGLSASVTVANGATDTTTGWPLAAGQETGYLPCENLNQFYRICSVAGDPLAYFSWY